MNDKMPEPQKKPVVDSSPINDDPISETIISPDAGEELTRQLDEQKGNQ